MKTPINNRYRLAAVLVSLVLGLLGVIPAAKAANPGVVFGSNPVWISLTDEWVENPVYFNGSIYVSSTWLIDEVYASDNETLLESHPFVINSSSGQLTLNPSAPRAYSKYFVWVQANPGLGTTYGAELEVNIVDGTLPTTTPYSGPTATSVSNPSEPGRLITVLGSNLKTVSAVEVDGVKVPIVETTETTFSFLMPASISAGVKSLTLYSDYGKLTVQDAFVVTQTSAPNSFKAWSKLNSDGNQVRFYSKNPIGAGKIQFFVDGKEIAWINAVDLTDPKLSFVSSNPYLVRSVTLNPGKNRFEIKLDGVRVWRATYVPKG